MNIEIDFIPTHRQHLAWSYLQDKTTTHILYGGSVGSGKSYLGCMWVFISCIMYPGVRFLIGRSRLNNLKKTTLNTFRDICKKYKYNKYDINSQSSIIYFDNGSEIILSDLYNYPNDENYERLGSLEITGAFIDELSEISYKGFEVLTSRIRYKLNEYKLTPKLFCASNPAQGWAKNYFYTPYMDGKLKDHIKFIPALPTDNPHLSKEYLLNLENTLDHTLKQRLLYGDWNFDSDEYNLFQYDKLQQSFYNEYFSNSDDKSIMTVDVGDLGKDKSVLCIWKGWNCVRIIKLEKNETTQVVQRVNELRNEYRIPINQIIIDSVGVGAGVASLLKGCIRYAGSERALNGEKFRNIKSQLMYRFAERVNNLECNFNFSYDDNLIQEALLYKKEFKDDVAFVTGKDDIKSKLGRSPDTIDSLYLRSYFDFKNKSIDFSVLSM